MRLKHTSGFGVAGALLAAPVGAQQFVVDDAAVVEYRACQVESWTGSQEFWILPACSPLPRTEITLGLSRFDAGREARDLHGVAEAKHLFRSADEGRWGVGLVAGGAFRFRGGGTSQGWIYAPLTAHAASIPLTLHLNAGWAFEREHHVGHTHDHAGFLWGARVEAGFHSRFGGWGELHGVSGHGAEAQAAFTTILVPERLAVDLSYSWHLSDGEDGLGLQVGLAWTPPPFSIR